MDFVVSKDDGIIPYVLTQILDACVNGVTLSDPDLPDNPVVYANRAFEIISGYPQAEIVGRNCRFLQGSDHDQEGLETIRAAMRKKEPCVVTLRNYRKSGERFVNRLSIRPLLDRQGNVLYYLGIQHDVTDLVESRDEVERARLEIGQLNVALERSTARK